MSIVETNIINIIPAGCGIREKLAFPIKDKVVGGLTRWDCDSYKPDLSLRGVNLGLHDQESIEATTNIIADCMVAGCLHHIDRNTK